MTNARIDGFSLLEVLVALSISALLAAVSYQAFSVAADSREQLQASMQRLATVQRTWQILERDFEHVRPRLARSEFASDSQTGPWISSLTTYDQTYPLLFSRGGQANLLQQERSNLQRVGYRLDGQALLRDVWPLLGPDDEPQSQSLMEGVTSLEFRFLGSNDQLRQPWSSQWPVTPSVSSELPYALEVILQVQGMGSVRRLFDLVGEY